MKCSIARGTRSILSALALSGAMLVLLALTAAGARAQSAAAPGPTFDAVSIKRSTSDRPPVGAGGGIRPDGSVRVTWATVSSLLAMAYPMPLTVDLDGLPDWAKRDKYDVIATSTLKEATPEQRRAMLQAMLVDRLKLAVHIEKHQRDIFRLVVARSDGHLGQHLTKIDTDCDAVIAARKAASAPGSPNPPPPITPDGAVPPCLSRMMVDRSGRAHAEGEATLDSVAQMLRGATRQNVVNETGLTGYYTFTLDFDRRSSVGGPSTAPPPDAGPSVFTAVQDQLGLKLVPAREDQDTVVVDHIEPPSEN